MTLDVVNWSSIRGLRGEIVGVPNYDSLHSLVSNDREVCLDINNRKGEKCVSAI